MTASPTTSSEIAQNACDYARIEAAILYLEEHFRDQPSLDDVARKVGLSPHHFQRLFRRWAGISPKRFSQFLTLDYAKAQLEASASVLDAAYDAGLSGPSRLHDLFVTYEAMSPGAFKQGGDGVDISYGIHPSPFGPCFVGQTERGICALGFADDQRTSASPTTKGATPKPSARSSSIAGPPRVSGKIRPQPNPSSRAFSMTGRRRELSHSGSRFAAPTSNSRCGRRCCASRPDASRRTMRLPRRWGCPARPARWAAPSPPTRSRT